MANTDSESSVDAGETDEIDTAEAPRLRELIGETLRSERREQGRTLADVAQEAAVSLPYLSEVERGRKDVSSDVLHAIHEALGLELDDVLQRSLQRLRGVASARVVMLPTNTTAERVAPLDVRAQSHCRITLLAA